MKKYVEKREGVFPRKSVSKGTIVPKKEDKIPKVIESLGPDFTDNDYVERFKEMYPGDWRRIERRYQQHVELNKPGKSFPMPEPKKYLLNVSGKYLNETRLKK